MSEIGAQPGGGLRGREFGRLDAGREQIVHRKCDAAAPRIAAVVGERAAEILAKSGGGRTRMQRDRVP
jgi:hypothetical protein